MRGTIFIFNQENFEHLIDKIDSAFQRDGWQQYDKEKHEFNNYDKEKIGKYLEENPLGSIIDFEEEDDLKVQTYVVEKSYK